MATHSSILAWRIPGTGEPVGLPTMASHRVGHNWSSVSLISRVPAMNPRWAEEKRVVFLSLHDALPICDFTFTFHFHALEKEMATHSSVLAWRIPGMGEPGGLPSTGSHRVRHD